MAAQVESIKWVPGTSFMVDGFRYQNPKCQQYFLSHYHSDHTTGLTKSFAAGIVYCSPVTAALVIKDSYVRLPPARVCPLQLNKSHVIDGVTVILLDANHCPGAVMFLFIVPMAGGRQREQVILHTGDMRWADHMAAYSALQRHRIDMLFLDTTYANPKHTHPDQETAVALVVDTMRKEAQKNPRTLFIVGSYHIGKERCYLGAAKALGWKVWVNPGKRRVLDMLNLPADMMSVLTKQKASARIQVSSMMGGLQPETLQQMLQQNPAWSHVVAFRPTGWTYRKNGALEVRREGPVTIYGVPYSEHSNYNELRSCVAALHPKRIVPTVNATTPAAQRKLVDLFADLMDLSRDKSRLDRYIRPAPACVKAEPEDGGEEQANGSLKGSKLQASTQEPARSRSVQSVQQMDRLGSSKDLDRLPSRNGLETPREAACSGIEIACFSDSKCCEEARLCAVEDGIGDAPELASCKPDITYQGVKAEDEPPPCKREMMSGMEDRGCRGAEASCTGPKKEDELDIASVDAAEQEKIMEAIRVANFKATIGGAKRQKTEVMSKAGGLKKQMQNSIAAFFRSQQ